MMLRKCFSLFPVFIVLSVILSPTLSGAEDQTQPVLQAVNRAPVAWSQTVATREDTSKAITLKGTDADGDPLTYVIVSEPLHGTLSGSGPNVTYTPAVNYFRSDSFTFKVNDGKLDSKIAKVSITVRAVNDPPVAFDQTVTTLENTPVAISLSASDIEGTRLTYKIVQAPSHGTLTGAGANRTYTPAANYNGQDQFTFRVNDGRLASNVATVSITVMAANHAPVAENQSISTNEDSARAITLSGADADGDPLSYTIVSGPTHGTLTGAGPNVTYATALNYHGPDSLTFKVSDGQVESNVATVSITVVSVNDPPVSFDQSITTGEDTSKAIILSGTDVEGDILTYLIVSNPSHGTLAGSGTTRAYTPAGNYFGPDSFTFKLNDGQADSNVATVSITVTGVNDPPVAKNQSITVNEDAPSPITLEATDADGDPLTYPMVSDPSHGTLTGSGPNRTYTPATNYSGSDSFTFKANDGRIDGSVAMVSITVTPINDPPVAQNQSVTIDEDTQKTITLTATDADGESLVFQLTAQPQHGTLSGTPPSVVYTPAPNNHGPDSFTFEANDGNAKSNTATVSITINPVNDPPVAQAQTVTTDEDAPKPIVLTATDVEGDSLIFVIASQPTHGTLGGTPPNVIYNPAADYHGPDTFTFKANDGRSDSNVGTVSITVSSVNDAPTAESQNVTLDEDTSKDIPLSGRDGDGDSLTYIIVSPPSNGTLTGSDANRTYTPAVNYHGSESFTFKVNDGKIDSSSATVSITVTSVNDVPAAQNQSVNTNENTPKMIILSAIDADGDSLTYTVVLQPAQGSLSGSGPNWTYTPNPGYYGPDSFTFTANDVQAASNVATVSITVNAVNDAPVAQNQDLTTEEDTPKQITLSATDTDGDTLTFAIVSWPSNGTLTGNEAQWVYTPNPGYQGSDTFTFKAKDGQVDSNVATVSITVTSVNDPPVAQDQGVTTDEDTAKAITLSSTDADNDNLTYQVAAQPAHGALSGTPPNLTYTPSANSNGSDSFTFKSSDGKVESNIATVSITINPVNDLPVAENQNLTTDENTSKAILLSATDVDGNSLAYQIVTQPVHGTLSGTPPDVTYTPNPGYQGSDSFTFDAYDGLTYSNAAEVLLNVVSRGIIITVAGNGVRGYGGDGGPATQAMLKWPYGVAVDASGNLYIADRDNERVRKVDANGIITTVAGNGVYGYGGDWGPATQATLRWPYGVAVDTTSNLYIADQDNYRVRRVNLNGIIRTIAGNGTQGYSGDGGLATQARLYWPSAVAVDVSGNIYIADTGNNCIRKVDKNGIITTVAGNGEGGFSGDGSPATQATINFPFGVAVDALGNLYIADTNNSRIRKVDANGIITTVAGGIPGGYGGDGGPATQASLDGPSGVAVDLSGNLYIADEYNHRIRKVDENGIITTIAGDGTWGYSGDGGPATQAKLFYPCAVAVDSLGDLYIVDNGNQRIRLVRRVFVPTKATIAGRVTDSSTGLSLSDATVTIKDALTTFKTKTRSDGTYTLLGLSPGDFMATFEKSGYLQQTVTSTLTAGQTQTLDVELTQAPPLTLNITSPQDGATVNESPITVSGNVTNNADVTVNYIPASVINNAFSASIYLAEGSNTITASATDQYGQTASQTINVTLISKGNIAGLVTDASTGLPLTGAIVSITDASGDTRNVQTDDNGQFIITDLLSGAFNGTITKAGYSEYPFSGTLLPGETKTINAALTPIPPTISNILVNNITKNSATITWTTDQPASSYVEYGATTSYGSSASDSTLATNHAVALTNLLPVTLYHFRVASTNGYGFSSTSMDHTFRTTTPTIILIITSPVNGGTINRRDVMVKGTIIDNLGNETGVTVNGKVATVYGNEFVVNHVPLNEGENTIQVIAADTMGTTETTSITINATTPQEHIMITANTESAIPPAEITLTVGSSLNPINATLTYTGPAEVEFLSSSLNKYRVRIVAEGIYYFTIGAKASSGETYNDTVAITILSKENLENLLTYRWNAMKETLLRGDIEGSLIHFASSSKNHYGQIFQRLTPERINAIFSTITDVSVQTFLGRITECGVIRNESGGRYSYPVTFVQDEIGLWKIIGF